MKKIFSTLFITLFISFHAQAAGLRLVGVDTNNALSDAFTNFFEANADLLNASVTGGGGTGSGETNTASNLGGGYGIFSGKSGVDLRFNSLTNDATITISSNLNALTIGLSSLWMNKVLTNAANITLLEATIAGKVDSLNGTVTAGNGDSLQANADGMQLSVALSNSIAAADHYVVSVDKNTGIIFNVTPNTIVSNSAAWASTNLALQNQITTNAARLSKLETNVYEFALSDETTDLTTGTKVTWRAPFAMTLHSVRASISTTNTTAGLVVVDIHDSGTTIMSTDKIEIDSNQKTSTTAATAPALTDTAIADDAELTFDVDTAGTGVTGLKVKIYYTKP